MTTLASGSPWEVRCGDARVLLPAVETGSVDCCVTSPPYWGLRDYGNPGQIGQEPTPEAYVETLVAVFREVLRTLKPSGTLWLNLGDSYTGSAGGWQGKTGARASRNFTARIAMRKGGRGGLRAKNLVGVPWMTALALRAATNCILRSDIIWAKPSPMPESVHDRPTRAHEHVFLIVKRGRYYYDPAPLRELVAASTLARYEQLKREIEKAGPQGGNDPGRTPPDTTHRNARDVWTIAATPSDVAHFAIMPRELARRCVLAGCPPGGLVLDPFAGTGTTGHEALAAGRRALLLEMNEDDCARTRERMQRAARQGVLQGVL